MLHALRRVALLLLLLPALPAKADPALAGLTVYAGEDRAYRYTCLEDELRVNGAPADAEVFQTLLTQLADSLGGEETALPTGEEVLCVELSLEGEDVILRYVRPAEAPEALVVVAAAGEERLVRQTQGWRAATILLACEGSFLPMPSPTP